MKPTQTKAWQDILSYYQQIKNKSISDFFDENRLKDFSFELNNIYYDYSKHRWDKKMLNLFVDLAGEIRLKEKIDEMFDGKIINKTEQRAVLHTALRQQNEKPVKVNGKNVIEEIRQTQERIKDFTHQVLSGSWKGITGKKITDVINIGIGGSDLGPKMVVQALSDYHHHLRVHYLSNIDPFQLDELLKKIDLESSLFIIVSKSFTTQETLTNAQNIQELYIEKYGKKAIACHFATVSTQVEKAGEFGIHPENIFPMWDWVGGRFSLWSPAGISIPLAIGYDNYTRLLKGAYLMDKHFKTTDFEKNVPVIDAFLTVLYNNFYGFETETFIPYSGKLKYLPDFLQQLIMESNGKYIDMDNNRVSWQTGNIIWGNIGTNAQHSFFQLLHQGTKMIPVNFIAEKDNKNTKFKKNHQILLANMIAQAEALMNGEKNEIPYKNFEGNRPSTTILLDEINPETLGSLIAYYEHRTFVEAQIWNINAFDQFGVELGKKLAKKVLEDFTKENITPHDYSTKQLVLKIKRVINN